MQINSVNQSMSYLKTRQNQNVKGYNRSNQPSFGKLLRLGQAFDEFWVLPTNKRDKAHGICFDLVDGILSSDAAKSFFKTFDANMRVGSYRIADMLYFFTDVRPTKYLLDDDYTKRFLQKYKAAGFEPDKNLISPMPEDYFELKDVVTSLLGKRLVPDCYRLDELVNAPRYVSEFICDIVKRFDVLKKDYIESHNWFVNSRLHAIDKDIENRLKVNSCSRRLGKTTTVNTMLDDLIKFHQDNFNSEL